VRGYPQVIPPLEAPTNQVNRDWLDVRAVVEDWRVWYGESNSKYWIEKGAEQRGRLGCTRPCMVDVYGHAFGNGFCPARSCQISFLSHK
jgi:hypothetical protein